MEQKSDTQTQTGQPVGQRPLVRQAASITYKDPTPFTIWQLMASIFTVSERPDPCDMADPLAQAWCGKIVRTVCNFENSFETYAFQRWHKLPTYKPNAILSGDSDESESQHN